LVGFDSAISEGLQLYSQISDLTISNGSLNRISLYAFSVVSDQDVLKEEVKAYLLAQSSPLNLAIFVSSVHDSAATIIYDFLKFFS
jgi:hypothetical protein